MSKKTFAVIVGRMSRWIEFVVILLGPDDWLWGELEYLWNVVCFGTFLFVLHMWLMIGQNTAKCDMRVLRVPVTWFFVVFF